MKVRIFIDFFKNFYLFVIYFFLQDPEMKGETANEKRD